MSLPRHEQRQLRGIDRALGRADPDLAAMLVMFARLSRGETMPGREQLLAVPAHPWRVLLWPVACAAFMVVFITGGGTGAARRSARSCSTAVATRIADYVRLKRRAPSASTGASTTRRGAPDS
jgi:hypothetical protein